jgi:hypothetical protein
MFLIGCAFVPAVLHRTHILSLVNPIYRRFHFLFLFFLAFHFYFYFSVHHPLPMSNVRNMVSRTVRPLQRVSYFLYDGDISQAAFQSLHFVKIFIVLCRDGLADVGFILILFSISRVEMIFFQSLCSLHCMPCHLLFILADCTFLILAAVPLAICSFLDTVSLSPLLSPKYILPNFPYLIQQLIVIGAIYQPIMRNRVKKVPVCRYIVPISHLKCPWRF